MYEKDYEAMLQKENTTLNFTSQKDFDEFEEQLEKATSWLNAENLSLYKVEPAEPLPSSCHSSNVQWDMAKAKGGIYAKLSERGSESTAVVNIGTASLSLNERAGIKCKLAAEYAENDSSRYANLVTDGLSYFDKGSKLLIRGGQLMAAHSSKYHDLPQGIIFSSAREYMKSNFSESRFVSARYTHDITEAVYSICDGNDAFLSEYAKDWSDAGLPMGLLAKTFPILIFSTSDTGRYPFAIKPRLQIGKALYPLGTDIELKHMGTAALGSFNSYADQAYAKVNKGLDEVREMITHEINHPYAAFVKVCSKTGLTKKVRVCVQEALENFKDEFETNAHVTAFNIFKAICDIQLYPAFTSLAPQTQLMCKECIYRIYGINWNEVDKEGTEEI